MPRKLPPGLMALMTSAAIFSAETPIPLGILLANPTTSSSEMNCSKLIAFNESTIAMLATTFNPAIAGSKQAAIFSCPL